MVLLRSSDSVSMRDSIGSQGRGNPLSSGNRVLLPYLILLIGLGLSLLVYYYFSKLTLEQDQSNFARAVQQIQDQVRLRIETSITLLRSGTGLFAASDSVEVREFERFVDQIELEKNYPGVQGIGFSRRFSAAEKAGVIAELKRQGVSGFKVWPEEPARNEYNAIIYLQPATPRNQLAIGFDMATEEVRRQAMETARDSGNPAASGRVQLVQERDVPDPNKQPGFLIYVPVYRNGASTATVEERRNSLLGYVYSPYRVGDFLEPVASENVSFRVYDGTDVKPENLLSVASNEAVEKPAFSGEKTLEVAGRKWTIAYATKPSFEQRSSRSLLKYTLLAGVLLSLLFAAVTRAEIQARSRAERAAEEVTKSEATIRNTLHERERAEEALRQTGEALRDANERALLEYERLVVRIKALAQALGTARELNAIFRALREFTNVSAPCNGFFVSLYDPIRDVRTACYGWADGGELDVSD